MFEGLSEKLSRLGEKAFRKLGDEDYGVKGKSHFAEAWEQMASFHRFCDLLPYEGYDESSGLFLNEETIGFVLEATPLVGSSLNLQKELSNLFQGILPEESGIQFLMWADPHIGDKCEDYSKSREGSGEILEAMALERSEYLKTFAYTSPQKPYTLRNFRCLISFTRPFETNKTIIREETIQILTQVKSTFEGAGMPLTVWDPEDLIRTLDGILHMDPSRTTSRSYRWNPLQSLSEQLFSGDSNMRVNQGSIDLNDWKAQARVFRVKSFPEMWSLGAMSMLIGDEDRNLMQIPCPFLIHYGVYIPRQDGPKAKTMTKARYVEKQANSPLGKYLPSIQREAAELDFVRRQLEKDGRIVQTQFTITLMGREEEMTAAEQVLKNYYAGKEWQLNREMFLVLPLFLMNLPMMWGSQRIKEMKRLKTMKTTLSTEPENLLPLQGEWQGTKTPGLLFAGRRGQLFSWFPFDGNQGGYSVSVIGKPGSGKSVCMQEMMVATLGLGGTVFVLDVGRSFEKTCASLGGQFIEFTPHSRLCLNPFTNIPVDDPEDAEKKLSMVKSVLMMMAAPGGELSGIEVSILEKAIAYVWREKGPSTTITDISGWLLAQQDARANDLGTMLFAYTKEGNYGRFFDGPATVNLDNRLVVVEFSDLEELKDLMGVIIQSMTIHILNRVYHSDRTKPIMLIIDEASSSLKGKQSSAFIDTAVRRFRKYEACIVIGTQTMNDFFMSPDAQAAFENCEWKLLFNQNAEAIELLKKSDRLLVTPHQEGLLKSLRTLQGQYSEMMVIGSSGYAVGRLILDRFSVLLYSSKGEEYSQIKEMMNQGISVKEAVHRVLEERGR